MISVCLASYNGEAYIRQQIDSILPQLTLEDELIISDDGSKDDTSHILASYSDNPIVKVYPGPRLGVVKNFESAIAHAKGDVIFLADQDDVWLPNKVEEMVRVFTESPDTLVVVSDLTIVDSQLEAIEPSYFDYRQVKTGFFHNLLRNGYIGAGMAFRSNLKKKILPFPEKLPMHDMWIGLLARNNVVFVKKQLTLYRRHNENASEIQSTSSFYQKFIWRLDLIMSLIRNSLKHGL